MDLLSSNEGEKLESPMGLLGSDEKLGPIRAFLRLTWCIEMSMAAFQKVVGVGRVLDEKGEASRASRRKLVRATSAPSPETTSTSSHLFLPSFLFLFLTMAARSLLAPLFPLGKGTSSFSLRLSLSRLREFQLTFDPLVCCRAHARWDD